MMSRERERDSKGELRCLVSTLRMDETESEEQVHSKTAIRCVCVFCSKVLKLPHNDVCDTGGITGCQ
eukprot:2322891-Amphidinium_carterae.1